MSKVCEICGKGPVTGNSVSHSHKKVRRRWLPNLQRIRVVIHGTVKRIQVCASCIRSDKIEKAV